MESSTIKKSSSNNSIDKEGRKPRSVRSSLADGEAGKKPKSSRSNAMTEVDEMLLNMKRESKQTMLTTSDANEEWP